MTLYLARYSSVSLTPSSTTNCFMLAVIFKSQDGVDGDAVRPLDVAGGRVVPVGVGKLLGAMPPRWLGRWGTPGVTNNTRYSGTPQKGKQNRPARFRM
jgi:hypothetical protein